MLILAKHYYVIVLLFLSGNFNDNLNADDQDIYRTTACTVRCLQQFTEGHKILHMQNQTNLNNCYEFCESKNDSDAKEIEKLKKIHENHNLKLLCRDDRSLTFRITLEQTIVEDVNTTTTTTNTTTTVYIIRMHSVKNPTEQFVYLSDDDIFTINGLKNDTIYNITAVAVHASNEYSVIAKRQQYATLRRGFSPGMVADVYVKKFLPDPTNALRLIANIVWRPSADMTCHYNIICFSPENEEFDLRPFEIRNPRHLYSYNLENLTFSSEFKVGIRSKNPNSMILESELFWMSFTAPSCVQWYNYNFNICAPAQPAGLQVEQTFLGDDKFTLNVSWIKPEHLPDYYTMRLLDLTVNGSAYVRNLTKHLNIFLIENVIICGIMFEVHLTAYTRGGNSTATLTDLTKKVFFVNDDDNVVKLFSAIFAPIFCICVLTMTVFIVCHRRAKLKRYEKRCQYFQDLEKKAPIDPRSSLDCPKSPADLMQLQLDADEKIFADDAMEIDCSNVTLYELLGEGAFGKVRRGIYNDEKLGAREVAVKMLKDQPSIEDVRAFRREIEVMKSVEKHTNIVGVIGHCTKRYNEMMLLTEFCSFGNLLDFLRNEWKYLHELQQLLHCKSLEACLIIRKQDQQQLQSINHERGSNSNNNKVFKIDSKIIDKLKTKYKNFNTSGKEDSTVNGSKSTPILNYIEDLTTKDETDNKRVATATTSTSTATATATENKSYGYDDICTNACRCQVDVMIIEDIDAYGSHAEAEQLEYMLQQKSQTTTTKKTLAISNCECEQQQRQRLEKKNKLNAVLTTATEASLAPAQSVVENTAYFKTLPAMPDQTMHQCNSRCPQNEVMGKREPLTMADLVDIAKQVAVGMEFLAKNKVVHRDLAARNVLVAPDRTIKIADFGLSRDIYQENIYKKTGNGKLPIKWLALESMTHQVYTTQSDVWSYGILLYEIVTLGGTPYPSIPTNRLLNLLKTGYRMEKPKNCGDEFYKLMYSCWDVNPTERPTFTEIIKILDNLSDDAMQQQFESGFLMPQMQKTKTTVENTVDDSYLKPL